jgi:uncharacterized protein (TIGR02996 family)
MLRLFRCRPPPPRPLSPPPDLPELRALCAAIIDRPDDVELRLILADWLEEHREPSRAELLRLQCRIAGVKTSDPIYPDLAEAEAALRRRHRPAWEGNLSSASALGGNARWWSLDRGLFRVFLSTESLLQPEVRARLAPEADATLVAFADTGLTEETAAALAASPLLAAVTRLHAGGFFRDDGVRALAASPHLGRLRWLVVDHKGVAPATVAALAAARWPQLTSLGLRGVGTDGRAMGDEGARDLLAVPWVGRLTQLELGANRLGDAGARALAASPQLANLEMLGLERNGIGDEGVGALARSLHLARLRRLYLTHNEFGAEGAAALWHSPHLTRCAINLWPTRLGPEGGLALASSPWLAHRTELDLWDTHLGDAGAEALARSPAAAGLRRLSLTGNDLGPAGAEALAASPHLAGLEELTLNFNHLGDAGVWALARSPYLGRLRRLGLGHNGVGDAGAVALAAAPHLAGLEELYLRSEAIGPAGARALAASPHLGRLMSLDLLGAPVGLRGRYALRRRFGHAVWCD